MLELRKKRHFKKECKALKKLGDGRQDRRHTTNVFIEETRDDSLILFLNSTELWIIDLGASFMQVAIRPAT